MDERALIEDLDARQNTVLDRLAELNARVESLLGECLRARDAALRVAEDPGRPSVPPVEMPGLSDRSQQSQPQQNAHKAPARPQNRKIVKSQQRLGTEQ